MGQCLKFPGIELLSVDAAGGTGNGFVHQGTTEVVGPGVQADGCTLRAHLHPRSLNVSDQRVQHQASDRVHEYGLTECGTRPGLSFAPQGGFHMNIAQRYELGNAAGARLQLTQT